MALNLSTTATVDIPGSVRRRIEAVIDMIVDQGALRLADGLDRVKLLGQIQAVQWHRCRTRCRNLRKSVESVIVTSNPISETI